MGKTQTRIRDLESEQAQIYAIDKELEDFRKYPAGSEARMAKIRSRDGVTNRQGRSYDGRANSVSSDYAANRAKYGAATATALAKGGSSFSEANSEGVEVDSE